jgi:hypothetical protein
MALKKNRTVGGADDLLFDATYGDAVLSQRFMLLRACIS